MITHLYALATSKMAGNAPPTVRALSGIVAGLTGSRFSERMKRTPALSVMLFATICLLSGSSGAQQQPAKVQRPAETRVLIVYLSRTNNTKAIAGIIHQKVGGKLVALESETPYPADYHTTVQQVVHENETGYLPPLKRKIEHMEEYDVLFLGFPTWDMQLPPPVKSFLHQYDLKGKTVIPFNTNGGYGPGSSFATVTTLCPRSTVLQGFSIRGGSERDGQYMAIKDAKAEEARKEVENWLRKIGILK
jgi:flavodoxin